MNEYYCNNYKNIIFNLEKKIDFLENKIELLEKKLYNNDIQFKDNNIKKNSISIIDYIKKYYDDLILKYIPNKLNF